MSEYKVDLVQCKINSIDISVDMKESVVLQMESQFSASVFEPNDVSDPTALIKVDCEIKDATGKMLNVTCSAELVFAIDPIPENRVQVLRKYTHKAIQEEISQRVVTILNGMGHNFAFS